MKTQITNKILLKSLVDGLGSQGKAQLELGITVSRSTIEAMLTGRVPSIAMQNKVAAFFKIDVSELFPVIIIEDVAA